MTPVYVQAQGGQGLLNVLVAGFPVDRDLASQLKQQTGGSDFIFLAGGKPLASSLPADQSTQIAEITAGESECSICGFPVRRWRCWAAAARISEEALRAIF